MPSNAQFDLWSAELERLARVLHRVGPDEVCCEGLTPRQCGILRTLVDKQGARISALASDAALTPSAMTRVLEKLEARNLVQRVRGTGDDGRAAVVSVTGRGREVRKSIDELMRERTKNIVAQIPAGLRPQLLAGIRLLNQALERGGCCGFTPDWTNIGVSCKIPDKGKATQQNRAEARKESYVGR